MLFADLLSLYLVTYLMLFILVSIYYMSALSLHIESTNSMIVSAAAIMASSLRREILRCGCDYCGNRTYTTIYLKG